MKPRKPSDDLLDPMSAPEADRGASEPAEAAAGPIPAGLDAYAAQLDREAAAIEAGPAVAGAAPPAPIDYAGEAASLVEVAHAALVPLYPSLAEVYTAEVRARLAGALGPLLAKYQFTAGGLFERWGPEIGLAVVVLPLVRPTMAAIRADRAAPKASEPPGKIAAAANDGATVTPPPPGTPMVPPASRLHERA